MAKKRKVTPKASLREDFNRRLSEFETNQKARNAAEAAANPVSAEDQALLDSISEEGFQLADPEMEPALARPAEVDLVNDPNFRLRNYTTKQAPGFTTRTIEEVSDSVAKRRKRKVNPKGK